MHEPTARDELTQTSVDGRGAGRDDVGKRPPSKRHAHVLPATHGAQGRAQ